MSNLKIISWNVNGIRAAYKKGLLDFIKKENADIVCLQEIKAFEEQLPKDLREIEGYELFINPADPEIKKGYSGVAIYSKLKPNKEIKNNEEEIINSTPGFGCFYANDSTEFSKGGLWLSLLSHERQGRVDRLRRIT